MLYFIDWNYEVPEGEILEDTIHIDRDENRWQFLTTHESFYIRYLGEQPYVQIYFSIKANNKNWGIKNTKHMKYSPANFEIYCNFRNQVRDTFTDDVWTYIEDLLIDRFTQKTEILNSEIL